MVVVVADGDDDSAVQISLQYEKNGQSNEQKRKKENWATYFIFMSTMSLSLQLHVRTT